MGSVTYHEIKITQYLEGTVQSKNMSKNTSIEKRIEMTK